MDTENANQYRGSLHSLLSHQESPGAHPERSFKEDARLLSELQDADPTLSPILAIAVARFARSDR